MASQFDELAKNLAGDMSRREALRRFGFGLLGVLLAALGLGSLVPQAARAQNSNCFYFCKAVYPNDPNAQAACGASGGLCSQCGPAAPAPRRSLCNAPGNNAFCCPAGQICVNNQQCVGGTCSVLFNVCGIDTDPMSGDGNCYCFQTPEGVNQCGSNRHCAVDPPCTSSAGCPPGEICIIHTGCGAAGVCVPRCAHQTAALPRQQRTRIAKHGATPAVPTPAGAHSAPQPSGTTNA